MEYQKFIPEGWIDTKEEWNIGQLQSALEEKKIMQGYVDACDENYNLYIHLGNQMQGVIPRNELEAIDVDEYGFCKTNICRNKVKQFLQFRVKEIYDEHKVLLSRKSVQEDALKWVQEELKPGMVVKGVIKNIRKFGVFVEIGGRYCRIIAY